MSDRKLPAAGTYQAALSGQIVISESSEGALMAVVPCRIVSDEVQWSGIKRQVLVKKDGTVQAKICDTTRKLFGDWMDTDNKVYRFDGDEEIALDKIPGAAEIKFDIVGSPGRYTSKPTEENPDPVPQDVFNIEWINLSGGGLPMPEPTSRKEMITKHGAKFKALFGGRKVTPQTEAKPAEQAELPVKTKLPPPPPKRVSKPCTDEEAYEAFSNANKGKSEEDLGNGWYDLLDKVLGGGARARTDISDVEWGKVKAACA